MNRLRELRKSHNLTQIQFCEKLNLVQNTLSNYETERHQIPDELKIKFANFFNCSVDYLLGREEIEQEKKQPEQVELEKKINLSEDEVELLSITKDLTEKEINRLIGFAKSMKYKELSTEEKINKLFTTKD